MAAIAQPRNTPVLGTPESVFPALVSIPIAAAVKIYPGTLVVLKGGYAAPCVLETGDLPAGRAESESGASAGLAVWDNSAGSAGAFEVPVLQGAFKWANAGTISQANVGGLAYGADNQTVTATATGASVVGKILRVDTDGVWVLSYVGQTQS